MKKVIISLAVITLLTFIACESDNISRDERVDQTQSVDTTVFLATSSFIVEKKFPFKKTNLARYKLKPIGHEGEYKWVKGSLNQKNVGDTAEVVFIHAMDEMGVYWEYVLKK